MTYDYLCSSCGLEFDVEQKITDQPVSNCPKCSSENVRRVISNEGGFVLKGSRWSKDGYQ